MAKIKKLTKGFTAEKNGVSREVMTEVYDIGFYIKYFINGDLENMTTRNSLSKANNLVIKERGRLLHKGWKITDHGEHNVRYDEKTLTFKI